MTGISFGDTIQVLLFALGVLGIFLNLGQMQMGNKQRAVEYINELYDRYHDDPDIVDIYYRIEYGKFEYEIENFHMSGDEKKVDKLLSLYDNIGKTFLVSGFSVNDLDYIAYHYLVVFQDKSIQRYLGFLNDWYQHRGIKVKPFNSFQAVGELLKARYYTDVPLRSRPAEKRKISIS